MAHYRIKVQWSFIHDGIEHAKKTAIGRDVQSFEDAEAISKQAADIIDQMTASLAPKPPSRRVRDRMRNPNQVELGKPYTPHTVELDDVMRE